MADFGALVVALFVADRKRRLKKFDEMIFEMIKFIFDEAILEMALDDFAYFRHFQAVLVKMTRCF